MKKFITPFIAWLSAFAFSNHIMAQNLVPNPGFELYTVCPNGIGLFTNNVADWSSPTAQGSPDYFNVCSGSQEAGIPHNAFGHQWMHGGKGQAGIIAWQADYSNGSFTNAYSEQIQARIIQPLQAGKEYCLTFFVSNGINPNSTFTNRNYIALDQVGVHFSSSKIQNSTDKTLSVPYHIINQPGRFVADTAGWTKISTKYKANGTEQWMTIGVFTSGNKPPNYKLIDQNATGTLYHSYLYIDDVSILPIANDTMFAALDSSYCDSTILPMTLKNPHNDGVYEWNNGGTDQQLAITKPGTYWCKAYTDCRWYVDTFRIRYNANGYLDLGKEAINCKNKPVVLRPKSEFDTYTWSTGAHTDSLVADQPGTYYLTVTGDCGTQSDTVNVYIQPPTPAPVVSDTVLCERVPEPTLNVKGTQITWYTSAHSPVGFEKQLPVNTGMLGTRTYYVTQKSGKCESERVPLSIYVKYKPKHELEPIAEMCEKYPDTVGKQLPDVSYKWSNGYFSCCMIPDRSGIFTVTVSNECGAYTDTVNVQYSICDTCIRVPNVFTPNRDGRNDIFKGIVTCPVMDFNMQIYNRWGNKLFETNDPAAGWNGQKDGMRSDIGTYVYMITYRSGATGKPKFIKGQVTLLH